MAQDFACAASSPALWRDDRGDRIRGVQPHFTDSQRADGDRRSDAIAVDATGRGLHRACDRLRMGCVEVSRPRSCVTNRGRPAGGLWIPWPPVAVCPDAPTRGAGRRRWHAERHHARRCGATVLLMFVAMGVAPAFRKRTRLYHRKHRCPRRVRRDDLLGCAPRPGQSPTPWIGLERINISVFLLWVVVLATVLLQGGSGRSGQPRAMRWTAGQNEVVRPWRQSKEVSCSHTLRDPRTRGACWLPVRDWMARWGTTPPDLSRVMAGDSLIVDPTYSGTMAVIVNARPEHIWP